MPEPKPLRRIDKGRGPAILLLHGFAMQPRTYDKLACLLRDRGARVIIPALFELPGGHWSFDYALDCIEATLDACGVERATLIGHSFGGGLELGLGCRCPERVVEYVFSDTLGVNEEFGLAAEALRHPLGIARMATRLAASSFAQSFGTHPVQLAEAGWWAFHSDRTDEIDAVRRSGAPVHVLWGDHDSILSRDDGEEFAKRLGADFHTACSPPGYGPIDHDWMFDDPELFVTCLEHLGLEALAGSPAAVS